MLLILFPVSVIAVSEAFRNRVARGYQDKLRWIRVLNTVKANNELEVDNAAKLPYKLINNLLYCDDPERGMRLCVSTRILEHEVFKLAHDEMRHPG